MSFARLWTKMANISVTVVQIEQLIELVRENPGLYDPSHHYHCIPLKFGLRDMVPILQN